MKTDSGSPPSSELDKLRKRNSRLVQRLRRQNRELEAAERRHNELFALAPIGIFRSTREGRFVTVNPAFARLLGYGSPEEVLRLDLRKDVYADETERERMISEIVRQADTASFEVLLRRSAGSTVWVLIQTRAIRGDSGAIEHFESFVYDIQRRRAAEEALRQSEGRFHRSFSVSPIAMSLSEAKSGRFVDVNERFGLLLGYQREDLIGRTSVDLDLWVDPADRTRIAEAIESFRPLRECEVRLRAKSGETRYVLGSVEPLQVGEEQVLLTVFQDITERRHLESQLRQSQKMEAMGRLAGGIAHDFNNLLTAILGYSDLLADEVGPESPLAESIHEIRQAGERAAALTGQLLAFSRRQVLDLRVLDLNSLVENMLNMLRRLIGEDVQLSSVLSAGLGRVLADAGQIEQLILNLSINARDAMPAGGRLTLETQDVELDEAYTREHSTVGPGRYVMLAVSDTGVGMTEETRSRIFEPFFTTKGIGKGTGLGLATVYGIVQQSGGFIWVYSEPGRGTTFKIYLPRIDAAVEQALPILRAEPVSRGIETVLLVEDDPSVRALARWILASLDYTVLEASGGEEALRIARRHPAPIHLLLTDVVMPETSGSDLAARLAIVRPGIRVLFMSGYTDDAIVRSGLIVERAHFLQKPFTPAVLGKRVREILDE